MLNIVLFGPPGAGKGTQSINIIDEYKLIHLSTGDMLRAEIAAETELGLRAKATIARGELVRDSTVIGIIATRLEANHDANGFVFDGFPRTTAQAEALDELLANYGQSIKGMIALEVEPVVLEERLMGRGKESGRPDDMDIEIIRKRICVYKEQTSPLKNYYRHQGKFHGVDGFGAVDEVFGRICEVIDNL
jgi:adenylate kinase